MLSLKELAIVYNVCSRTPPPQGVAFGSCNNFTEQGLLRGGPFAVEPSLVAMKKLVKALSFPMAWLIGVVLQRLFWENF